MKSQTIMPLGVGGPGRADPEEPGADPVGPVHAEHLLRPEHGQAVRPAQPASCSTCSRLRSCGPQFGGNGELAAPKRPADRGQRRPGSAPRLSWSRRPPSISPAARRTIRAAAPPALRPGHPRRTRRRQIRPSNERALEKFEKAAERMGHRRCELITATISRRLAEFDALFIRETTSVNHHTYRFARRAAAEGLVVIDDPESIVRCTNKVYLAELLRTPRRADAQDDHRPQGQRGRDRARSSACRACSSSPTARSRWAS